MGSFPVRPFGRPLLLVVVWCMFVSVVVLVSLVVSLVCSLVWSLVVSWVRPFVWSLVVSVVVVFVFVAFVVMVVCVLLRSRVSLVVLVLPLLVAWVSWRCCWCRIPTVVVLAWAVLLLWVRLVVGFVVGAVGRSRWLLRS